MFEGIGSLKLNKLPNLIPDFKTILSLAVGKNLPNKIAQRNVQVCLARSKYFPTPDIMLQLIRQCTEERHLPFAITEDL